MKEDRRKLFTKATKRKGGGLSVLAQRCSGDTETCSGEAG